MHTLYVMQNISLKKKYIMLNVIHSMIVVIMYLFMLLPVGLFTFHSVSFLQVILIFSSFVRFMSVFFLNWQSVLRTSRTYFIVYYRCVDLLVKEMLR